MPVRDLQEIKPGSILEQRRAASSPPSLASRWLLRKGETVFFKGVVCSSWTTLQLMAPHVRVKAAPIKLKNNKKRIRSWDGQKDGSGYGRSQGKGMGLNMTKMQCIHIGSSPKSNKNNIPKKEKEKTLVVATALCVPRQPQSQISITPWVLERHRVHHHFRDDKTWAQPPKGKGGTLSCPLSKQVGAAVAAVSHVSSTC